MDPKHTPTTAPNPVANLKAWRERMGYSQRDAAEELGCARGAYAGWESGAHRVPRYIELACAALALGIEPATKKAA